MKVSHSTSHTKVLFASHFDISHAYKSLSTVDVISWEYAVPGIVDYPTFTVQE